MPSLNRIKRLSVGVLAGAALAAVPASAASANSVELWACHGPDGQPLGIGTLALAGTVTGSCDSNSDGLTASLGATPAAGDASAISMSLPAGVTWQAVQVTRSTTGLTGAAGTGQSYTASRNTGAALETNNNADYGTSSPVFNYPAGDTSDYFKIGVACGTSSSCSASPTGLVSVTVNRITAIVDDSTPPTQAVGSYRSPAAGHLVLDVAGTDGGLGLSHSIAYVQGGKYGTVQVARNDFAGTNCSDLTPNTGSVQLRADAQCLQNGHVSLDIDTTTFDDGDYNLIVETYDIAGNRVSTTLPLSIWNHPPASCAAEGAPCTKSLTIGTSSPTVLPSGNTNAAGTGGVAGASASSCSSPKLSMFLSQKPLRVSHGVPVLKYGKRYRFRGRLTCVIKGKRQSAPKRTRIDLQNKVGKKTVSKGGTTVRDKGAITIILAYKSSRTLIFKFTNTNGKVSQVKIPIKIAHR